MSEIRLIPRSKYMKKSRKVDSIRDRKIQQGTAKTNKGLLRRAEFCWQSMEDFRRERLRNYRYVYGDQWGDMVWDGQKYVKERTKVAKATGGVVLQNNHMFKIANTIEGVYLRSETKPVCFATQKDADLKGEMMTNAVQTNCDNNMMTVLMQNAMRETINGGMPVLREDWDVHNGVYDSYTYVVDPGHFFFESKGQDPRMWDVSMVGEFRDFDDALDLAAEVRRKGGSYGQEEIEKMYKRKDYDGIENKEQFTQNDNLDFIQPDNPFKCRAYYIWTLEYKERYRVHDPLDFDNPLYRIEVDELDRVIAINEQRRQQFIQLGITDEAEMSLINYGQIPDEEGNKTRNLGRIIDQFWHFQLLTPYGDVLVEYDTPYRHGSHPYVFMCHHFVNGKVYPFISVTRDQQRYVNRLITLHDLAISSSIKGLKMIPKNLLGGLTPRQFAKKATEYGGWIFYDPDPNFPNLAPQIIQQNSRDIGTAELLKIELDSITDITNVSGALQGKTPANGTAASRYAMEMENSTTSISSLFTRFTAYENELYTKKMQVIHQYYKDPRNISLKHSNGYASYGEYEPKEVEDIIFKVQVKESAATPVSRMQINDLLLQMMGMGVISPVQMLRHGYFEGMDGILQELEAQQQAAQGGAAPNYQLSPGAQQILDRNVNADTVQMVKDALSA